MEAILSKGKNESFDEEGKKATYILDPLAPEFVPRARRKIVLPVEVLVKIFNFLPNHDIRRGISLTCKKFYEICQDESLVPVKDLCIYGRILDIGYGIDKGYMDSRKWSKNYNLRNIEAVKDIIIQSKNLNFLKIKSLNTKATSKLVSIALKACPKLRHLEIVEPTDGEYCM